MDMNDRKPVILVVDDETHILHVVRLKLSNAGFEVLTAEDGELGLELALKHRPSVVITDYHMPYMTGLELCIALRQNPTTCDIPALMLTARGFSLSEEALGKTSIVGVLSKPFSPREVLMRVQTLVNDTVQQETGR